MAMRMQVFSACAILAAIIVFAIAPGGADAGEDFSSGDEWVYDFDMNLDTMSLSGAVTYSYDGESTKTVSGSEHSTYEIGMDASLTISGATMGFSVTGTAAIEGSQSLDQATLDTIVSDYNMSMTTTIDFLGSPMTMEYWDHNVSTYSPPGGIGEEPEQIDVWTSWTKTHTVRYESMTYDDGNISTSRRLISVTETYTYLGVQSVTVPAGTFECEVLQIDDGSSTVTQWYSEEVGSYVKSSYEAGSSESGTEALTSYSYSPPSSTKEASTVWVIGGLVVAVVAVVLVIVVWVLLGRKSPPQGSQTDPLQQEPRPPYPPPGWSR